MSFRLFVYYCALVGAWTAMLGWAMGRYVSDRLLSQDNTIAIASVRGGALGLFVACGLGLVDALWNLGFRNILQLSGRLAVAMFVGGLGGLLGGCLAQWLVVATGHELVFFVGGWALAGLLIGASIHTHEWLHAGNLKDVASRFFKCTLGGGLGGLIGGIAALLLRDGWLRLFGDKEPASLWSPTAIGFVTLGLCIGLLVGLAQVVLKEAWIKVEAGFRAGREMILAKEKTLIGRAEGSDIALFGDSSVERTHAQIVRNGAGFLVEDIGTASGTYVNDRRIGGKAPLRSGDLIRVGKSVLRFSERQKR
jgi:hypothetical protein